MTDSITIGDRKFEVTVREHAAASWQWILSEPGKLVLSGEARSRDAALREAHTVGRALAQQAA
jgi:hypothetical protein